MTIGLVEENSDFEPVVDLKSIWFRKAILIQDTLHEWRNDDQIRLWDEEDMCTFFF